MLVDNRQTHRTRCMPCAYSFRPCLGLNEFLESIIANKLEAISVSNDTIQRLISEMAEEISSQFLSKLKSWLHGVLAIQLDEPTDVSSVSQLMIFFVLGFHCKYRGSISFLCSSINYYTINRGIIKSGRLFK